MGHKLNYVYYNYSVWLFNFPPLHVYVYIISNGLSYSYNVCIGSYKSWNNNLATGRPIEQLNYSKQTSFFG